MLLLCKLCLMLGLCDYAKKQCWHNRAPPTLDQSFCSRDAALTNLSLMTLENTQDSGKCSMENWEAPDIKRDGSLSLRAGLRGLRLGAQLWSVVSAPLCGGV